jgi:uncharacterized membrane protein YkvA (DUF1232 family)
VKRGIFKKADYLLRHPEELLAMLGQGLKKAYAKRTALFSVFEDFLLLFRLVKAWVMGEYRDAPRKAIFWSVIAILYFISPLDMFPDIFPGGYLDDIAFITFVLGRIRGDLDQFTVWEKKKKS